VSDSGATPTLARRYTEEEMALILKRAAAMQAAHNAPGVSLEELQEIGSQVGIDPALIAHVVRSGGFTTERRSGVLAAPASHLTIERRVDVPATTADYGRVLEAIRRVAGVQGNAQEVFDSLEWKSGSDRDAVWYGITVTGRPDATYMRVDGENGVAVALMHLVGFGAGLMTAGFVFSAQLGLPAQLAITAAAAVGILGVVRGLWRRLTRRVEGRAQALADEIEREVRQLNGPASVEGRLPTST
jgi:hypothetical protein